MLFNYRVYGVLALILLEGCVTQPAVKPGLSKQSSLITHQQHITMLSNISHFAIQGRIAVNANGKGFSGGIAWQHEVNTDNIDLFTPLGSKAANIEKSAQGVVLTTTDNKVIKADNAETLTEKTLGWRLPLAGLSDWALGKPTESAIQSSTWDDKGRLLTLVQDGWQITYEHYSEQTTTSLPGKVNLKNDKLNLKLLIEQWQFN